MSEPDQVIRPVPEPTESTLERSGELLAMIPNLLRLLYRLISDPRVPRRAKVLLGLAVGYVVIPIDFIPDALPVAGAVDDLFIVAMAIGKLIERAGEDVVLEHWDGPPDFLRLIESVLKTAHDAVPTRIRKILNAIA